MNNNTNINNQASFAKLWAEEARAEKALKALKAKTSKPKK